MTVQAVWNLVRFHWVALLVALLLGGVGGAAAASAQQPVYTATSQLFVTVSNGRDASQIAQGATYSTEQARNFAAVGTLQIVLASVIDDLNLDLTINELRAKVAITVPLNTSIISISAKDPQPELAAKIANSVASGLAGAVGKLAPDSRAGTTPVQLQPVETAEPPSAPSAPRPKVLMTLGALLALSIAVLLLAAKDHFRAKVRTPEQASTVTGAPLVGTITAQRDVQRRPMISSATVNSLRAEQYRQIRTNLRFLQMDHDNKVLVFTSALPGEGKSTTAANVAAAIAAAGSTVCLVEADLRKPSLAAVLDLEGGVGLTTVITGEAELDDVIQPWGATGLHVVLAGELPPNPSELLGSSRAETVLNAIRDRFDVTIIDGPPLLPVTDAAILSRLFGGAILVVSERRVQLRDLRRAVAKMTMVEAPILGCVVTMSRAKSASAKRYAGYASAAAAARTPPETSSRQAPTPRGDRRAARRGRDAEERRDLRSSNVP